MDQPPSSLAYKLAYAKQRNALLKSGQGAEAAVRKFEAEYPFPSYKDAAPAGLDAPVALFEETLKVALPEEQDPEGYEKAGRVWFSAATTPKLRTQLDVNKTGQTAESCAAQCNETEWCRSFMLHDTDAYNKGTCTLFNRATTDKGAAPVPTPHGKLFNKTGEPLGYKKAGRVWFSASTTPDLQTQLDENKTGQTAESCAAQCDETEWCRSFMLHDTKAYNNGKCTLFNKASTDKGATPVATPHGVLYDKRGLLEEPSTSADSDASVPPPPEPDLPDDSSEPPKPDKDPNAKGGFPMWASVTIGVVGLLVFLAAVAALAVWFRRRRQYQYVAPPPSPQAYGPGPYMMQPNAPPGF